MPHTYKPDFETIFGIYVVSPGYLGVKRRFGRIIGVIEPSYTLGLPFIHDIAAVPETPGTISDLEEKVRSSDNRSVGVNSNTTFVITDPVTFMRKAPDNYLDSLEPKVKHAVQQTIGEQYTAKEVVEKNDSFSEKVQEQLNSALGKLGWGIACNLFRYTATTDPADLISGDAAKLRQAELADTKGKMGVAVAQAEADGQVQYTTSKYKADTIAYGKERDGKATGEVTKIMADAEAYHKERDGKAAAEVTKVTGEAMFVAQKYQIDGRVYSLQNEGNALATTVKTVGMAEADIRERNLNIFADYIGKAAGILSSISGTLKPGEAEMLIPYILAPMQQMLATGAATAGGGLDSIKEALINRVNQRLAGQAQGNYIQGVSVAGINPNVALLADAIPKLVEQWKSREAT